MKEHGDSRSQETADTQQRKEKAVVQEEHNKNDAEAAVQKEHNRNYAEIVKPPKTQTSVSSGQETRIYTPTSPDMNNDQGISIPQGPITRTRAKKLQQTLYSYIQAMVSSSKEILEELVTSLICYAKLSFKTEMN